MIIETDIEYMKKHIIALGVSSGDNLIVHSSLFAFGRLKFELTALVELFLSLIGPEGSLIVPTYTFHLGENDLYVPDKTTSEGVGLFSEAVRRHDNTVRSYCPIHNHAGIGLQAEQLKLSDPEFSFGMNSDFDLFHKRNFKIILLGSDFSNSCTYLHHMEAVANVPYRKWIKLKRIIRCDGKIKELSCNYFARNEKIVKTTFNRIIPYLNNLITEQSAYGKSYAVLTEDLHQATIAILNKDPYFFVKE